MERLPGYGRFDEKRKRSPFSSEGPSIFESQGNPEKFAYDEEFLSKEITRKEFEKILGDTKNRYPEFSPIVDVLGGIIGGLFSSTVHGVTIGAILKVLGASVSSAAAVGGAVGGASFLVLGLGFIIRALVVYGRKDNRPTRSSSERKLDWRGKGGNAA